MNRQLVGRKGVRRIADGGARAPAGGESRFAIDPALFLNPWGGGDLTVDEVLQRVYRLPTQPPPFDQYPPGEVERPVEIESIRISDLRQDDGFKTYSEPRPRPQAAIDYGHLPQMHDRQVVEVVEVLDAAPFSLRPEGQLGEAEQFFPPPAARSTGRYRIFASAVLVIALILLASVLSLSRT